MSCMCLQKATYNACAVYFEVAVWMYSNTLRDDSIDNKIIQLTLWIITFPKKQGDVTWF